MNLKTWPWALGNCNSLYWHLIEQTINLAIYVFFKLVLLYFVISSSPLKNWTKETTNWILIKGKLYLYIKSTTSKKAFLIGRKWINMLKILSTRQALSLIQENKRILRIAWTLPLPQPSADQTAVDTSSNYPDWLSRNIICLGPPPPSHPHPTSHPVPHRQDQHFTHLLTTVTNCVAGGGGGEEIKCTTE